MKKLLALVIVLSAVIGSCVSGVYLDIWFSKSTGVAPSLFGIFWMSFCTLTSIFLIYVLFTLVLMELKD